ncbi:hypothetical protein Caci_3012 [Catenulispora acidiphila DSM 44928]|uniref:Uncharacterized protein n=1 Tax=Catenulispora acidiphila (strain DSM 44928 / JCM 14897 / NBRC 102108 / NRRL B-24433 / ID139908) TaxID=479433 RepID=C7Q4F2_CATAD|nr:hypothetical protein [Catenulispora acidiphila]ACU71921.1 hypothetical protein Caci_3012 [Catenulispora acidiphila DSM 44928]
MIEDRPRWASLTAEQREIATTLYLRAQELIDSGMSIAEAMETAAIHAGHVDPLLSNVTTTEGA